MKKIGKVVMLPTEKAIEGRSEDVLLCIKTYEIKHDEHMIDNANEGELSLGISYYCDPNYFQPQHLYISSDDKLKVGDIVLCDYLNGKFVIGLIISPIKSDEDGNAWIIEYLDKTQHPWEEFACKKIIATTDPDLYFYSETEINGFAGHHQIAQIPKLFMHLFVKRFNELDPINQVLVEYAEVNKIKTCVGMKGKPATPIYEMIGEIMLILNDDNTVNISVAEQKTYTRDEVIEIAGRAAVFGHDQNTSGKYISQMKFKEWLNENFPE